MVVGEIAEEKEVVIIGGGPAGYTAAIRAAQLGLEVTLIEKNQLGGLCLNEGCIPSKVFAHAAQKACEKKHLQEIGLEMQGSGIDLDRLQAYKEKVVSRLRKGVEGLCQANKIEVINGTASFLSEDRIGVESGMKFEVFRFKHALVAAGTEDRVPETVPLDGKRILSMRQVYRMVEVPEYLIIAGSGYQALETAFSFRAAGAQVTLLYPDERLPYDSSISRELERNLKKQKIKLIKGAKINQVSAFEGHAEVKYRAGEGVHTVAGSQFCTETARHANLEKLGLNRLGLRQTEEGLLDTDHEARTSVSSIFAAGDITAGPALAVKAIKQGKAAAEAMAGGKPEVDLTFMPEVIHAIPPAVSAGMTEEKARKHYSNPRIGQFSMAGNGYAAINGETGGFVKMISDPETDAIIGFHAVGPAAVEMLAAGTLGLEMAAREEDFRFPLYAHPSFNEGILEAAEALKQEAIHMAPAKIKKEPVDSR
ncbi:dihydrolipoyl dehydrogenase family protein [Bacillus marinisedimentorum]|uniref:dihydrolipoyl dehydrogenase family protein n=1 Tax=Bacillus marinisedimentorum TaxID=1821260 RepID=UPI000872C560|nr:FAD-dependent oxidoreductase [Bacillus marinisedimentorum]